MNCSMPGFPVLHHLPKFAQTQVHWFGDGPASVAPFSCCIQSFPASGSFPMSRLFTSGGQNIAASTTVLDQTISIKNVSPFLAGKLQWERICVRLPSPLPLPLWAVLSLLQYWGRRCKEAKKKSYFIDTIMTWLLCSLPSVNAQSWLLTMGCFCGVIA